MSEEQDREQVEQEEQETEKEQKGKFTEGIDTLVDEVNKVVRVAIVKGASTAETIGENLKETLQSTRSNRENVVMVRIDSESLERVDELVETGIAGSRSEAAAFLIGEGIKSRQDLFDKIAEKVQEIRNAKEELRKLIDDESAQPTGSSDDREQASE